jgi:hypothetical protein
MCKASTARPAVCAATASSYACWKSGRARAADLDQAGCSFGTSLLGGLDERVVRRLGVVEIPQLEDVSFNVVRQARLDGHANRLADEVEIFDSDVLLAAVRRCAPDGRQTS